MPFKLNLIFRKNRAKNDKGFTLIELIIVVAVIGILTAIAIPVYGSIQETAKRNAVVTSVNSAATSAKALDAKGANKAEIEAEIKKLSSDEISMEIGIQEQQIYFEGVPYNDDLVYCVYGSWQDPNNPKSAYEGEHFYSEGVCGPVQV